MAKPKGTEQYKLIDLTMRFDSGHQNPDRFEIDPSTSEPVRPDPNSHAPERPIKEAATVAGLLRRGNCNYAGFIKAAREAAGVTTRDLPCVSADAQHWLFVNKDEVALTSAGVTSQEPYAAVLGCIDARVPVELITGQSANDVFVIRTAGNILTSLGEGMASLNYILGNHSVGSPHGDPHKKTVRAILVLGHTRCGAISAAYEAFKPGGNGTVGLPPSLAALLYEMKPAVEFVLNHPKCKKLKNDDEKKDAASFVNAVFSHEKVKQLALDTGTATGLTVYYGVYNVAEFYLEKTNLDGAPNQHYCEACSSSDSSTSFSWTERKPKLSVDVEDALAQDAIEFAEGAR